MIHIWIFSLRFYFFSFIWSFFHEKKEEEKKNKKNEKNWRHSINQVLRVHWHSCELQCSMMLLLDWIQLIFVSFLINFSLLIVYLSFLLCLRQRIDNSICRGQSTIFWWKQQKYRNVKRFPFKFIICYEKLPMRMYIL